MPCDIPTSERTFPTLKGSPLRAKSIWAAALVFCLAGASMSRAEEDPIEAYNRQRYAELAREKAEAEARLKAETEAAAKSREEYLARQKKLAEQAEKAANPEEKEKLQPVYRKVRRLVETKEGKREMEVPVLRWPTSVRPAIQYLTGIRTFDGYDIETVDLKTPGFTLRNEKLENFARGAQVPGTSLTLQHQQLPGVFAQFYYFEPMEFYPVFDADFLHGYVEGLRQRHGKNIVVHDELNFYEDISYYLGEAPIAKLHYSLTTASGSASEVLDYVAFPLGKLLILRVVAPREMMPDMERYWNRTMASFDVVAP